jgi:hypothetical protein
MKKSSFTLSDSFILGNSLDTVKPVIIFRGINMESALWYSYTGIKDRDSRQ